MFRGMFEVQRANGLWQNRQMTVKLSWARQQEQGVVLSVRVIPRASRTQICGLQNDALKIKLQAPPVDGKANKQLVKFLSKKLGVSGSAISVIGGETSHCKRVLVRDGSVETISECLLPQEGAES
jgi:uncharacterized protein (TIGR00251 family)